MGHSRLESYGDFATLEELGRLLPALRSLRPIHLLRPFPAGEMEAFEVSPDVGNVKNTSPELLDRHQCVPVAGFG